MPDSSAFAARGAPPGAHLGLSLWVAPEGGGSLYYADGKGYRIAAGAPRAAHADESGGALSELFRGFEADCRRLSRRPLYFGLPGPFLGALDPQGLRGRWHAGDIPVFGLARWGGASNASTSTPPSVRASAPPSTIRSQMRRARNQGVTVRRLASAPGPGDPAGPALRACLVSWLRDKPLPPMQFVTTPFLFDPWPADGVFIAEREGRIEGFLVGSSALFEDSWRVDAVGRAPAAPNGCAELLIAESFRYAAGRGFGRATLGLAPLSRRSGQEAAPPHWMDRVAEFVREAGVPGYSFAGLETFKAKFEPEEWVPAWCVSGGGKLSFRDMREVARAFAGGSLSGYGLRALLWMLGKRSLSM